MSVGVLKCVQVVELVVWRDGLSVLNGVSRESCGLHNGTNQHGWWGPAQRKRCGDFDFLDSDFQM